MHAHTYSCVSICVRLSVLLFPLFMFAILPGRLDQSTTFKRDVF